MRIKEIYNSNKDRILTGLVLFVVALAVFLIDNLFVTWVVLGAVYLFAFYEAMTLFGLVSNRSMVYALAIWLAAYIYPNPDDIFYFVVIVALSIMVHKKDVDYKRLAPFLYPTVSMLFMFALYKDFGMSTLVWLVILISFVDIGAYVVGKSIGKTPFSKTSPNKTWEGVVAGIVAGTAIGSIVGLVSVSLSMSVFISFLVSLCAIWGDLFESYLKREADVKDSGSIFPGHGGMLDRVDGYMFSSIIMLVLLRGLL